MSLPTRRAARRTLTALAVTTLAAGLGATAGASAQAAPTAPTTTIGTAAQVPWASVGKGWVVAQVTKNGHENLVLVSPTGQSYQLMTVDGLQLDGVSSDARRVMLVDDTGIRTVDLRTGKTLAHLPYVNAATFTKPTGTNIIGEDGGRIRNYSALTGKLTTTGAPTPLAVWGVLPSPSGTSDVVATGSGARLFTHATLQPTRTFASPKGYSPCTPFTFVTATAFRETCVANGSSDKGDGMNSTTEVFEQDITGGAPKAVTNGTYPAGDTNGLPLGFAGAWQTSKGTVAAPNVAVFTGSTRLFRVVGGKIAQTYSVPLAADAAKMTPMVKTMQGDSAYFMSNLHEPGPSIAVRYDVATGKVTYLAGNHSQYGGVVSQFDVVQ